MVAIFLSILFFLTLCSFFLYGVFQFMFNFRPSKKRIISDLEKLKKEISEWTSGLVPWSREEMELLSFNQIHKKVKKGFTKSVKGVFTSIYHEPLLAYNYKRYMFGKNNALLVAHTSNHEFAYRIKKDDIFINIDNEFAGVLKDRARFYGGPKDQLIARINIDDTGKLYPILVGEKAVACLVNAADKKHVPNPRALKFVAPMSNEEEKIFLSLAAFKMIMGAVNW